MLLSVQPLILHFLPHVPLDHVHAQVVDIVNRVDPDEATTPNPGQFFMRHIGEIVKEDVIVNHPVTPADFSARPFSILEPGYYRVMDLPFDVVLKALDEFVELPVCFLQVENVIAEGHGEEFEKFPPGPVDIRVDGIYKAVTRPPKTPLAVPLLFFLRAIPTLLTVLACLPLLAHLDGTVLVEFDHTARDDRPEEVCVIGRRDIVIDILERVLFVFSLSEPIIK